MEFRECLARCEAGGQVTHVTRPVSTRLELSRHLRSYDGVPVLFERVEGSELPVAANLFAGMDLLARNLGIEKDRWIPTVSHAIEAPSAVRSGPTDLRWRGPDLDGLPILTHYPHDQGPYVTAGIVFAERAGARNASFHRLCRIGPDRFVGRLVEKRDLHTMYLDAKAHGEDLGVSIAIGNRPGVLVAAATTVERGRDELGIASALEPDLRVAAAETNRSAVPADAEVVLEGRILHDETSPEGPFVDLTNTYDVVRTQPVIVIDRVGLRPNAVYHALLPGGREHRILMGAPRTPTIYRALRDAGLDVVNVYLTEGGSGWLDAVVAIRKRSEGDPRVAIEAAIAGHRSLKKITIVDHDVDVTDPHEVNYAVTMYWEAGKETVLRGVKGSSLDPMATADGTGSKLAIDATRPLAVPPEKRLKMTRVEPPAAG